MNKKSIFLVTLLTMPFVSTWSQNKNGEALYKNKCVECHVVDAMGIKDQEAPMLRGQFDWYIISQLNNFLKGERKNPKMLPFIQDLSAQDIKDLASYISKLD